MDEKSVLQLHECFQDMSSEKLSAIWVENDRNRWADEAFEAIRRILSERNEAIPEQREAPQAPQVPAWRQREQCFRDMSSEKLSAIWVENDRNRWTEGVFEAIRRILSERNEDIPEQREAPQPPQPPQVPAWRQRERRLRRNAALLFGGGLVLSTLPQSVFKDAFVTGCLVASIVLFIASFTEKRPRD